MTGKTQTEEFAPAKEVPDLAHYIGMIRLPPEHAADGVHRSGMCSQKLNQLPGL